MEQAFDAYDDITSALGGYFDGIHFGDTDKLRQAFHPQAHLYSATDGEFVDMTLSDYLELVAGRQAPADGGHPRNDRIITLDLSGPETAHAKVELSVPPKYFVDYLTLLKIDGRWQIISKTFQFVLHE